MGLYRGRSLPRQVCNYSRYIITLRSKTTELDCFAGPLPRHMPDYLVQVVGQPDCLLGRLTPLCYLKSWGYQMSEARRVGMSTRRCRARRNLRPCDSTCGLAGAVPGGTGDRNNPFWQRRIEGHRGWLPLRASSSPCRSLRAAEWRSYVVVLHGADAGQPR